MDVFASYAPFIQDFIYRNGWESLRSVRRCRRRHLQFLRTTSCWLHPPPPARLRRRSSPYSPSSTRIPPRASACSTSHRSRHSSTTSSAVSPSLRGGRDSRLALARRCRAVTQEQAAQAPERHLADHAGIPRGAAPAQAFPHPALFGDLRFIVIDEIHSLMRADRGGQCLCLIERLSRLASCNPRRIGLSATIGDLELAGCFLGSGSGRDTIIPASRMRSSVGACPCRTSSWERAPRKWRREKMRQLLRTLSP